MWKPALLLLAVLSIGGCGLSSYLPSMTDASPAVTVFVIQDVYGSPSVIVMYIRGKMQWRHCLPRLRGEHYWNRIIPGRGFVPSRNVL